TPDDVRSLVFDSAVIVEDIEILGNPKVVLRLSSDQTVAKTAVRINEIGADGKSWNVTYGVLNLTHRDGHEKPSPLVPGKQYEVEIPCYFVTHRFKKGSRIRVALTESLWPMLWPSPRPVSLQIATGESRLLLPVRPAEAIEDPPPMSIIRGAVAGRDSADAKILATHTTQVGPDASGSISIRKEVPEPETL